MQLKERQRVCTHAKLQCRSSVIEQDLAIVTTIRQMELEHLLAAQSNVSPEFLPAGETDNKGRLEGLAWWMGGISAANTRRQ